MPPPPNRPTWPANTIPAAVHPFGRLDRLTSTRIPAVPAVDDEAE